MNRRGQLLLLGALALAAVIVSLAIVLNAAVFTDTLATRGAADATNGGAVASVDEVRHGVGALLIAANAGGSSYGDREDDLDSSIGEFENSLQRYYAERDRFVSISSLSYKEGTNVSQSSSSEFTKPSGGDSTWNLTTTSTPMRRFGVTVDSGLASSESNAFQIIARNSSGTEWTISVYENSSGAPTVAVESSESATVRRCTASSTSMTVDITAGTVAGKHCPALAAFNRADGPYELSYKNGNQIRGTYHVVFRGDPGSETDLIESEVVYSVTLDLSYQSMRTNYETELTVAPGEMR